MPDQFNLCITLIRDYYLLFYSCYGLITNQLAAQKTKLRGFLAVNTILEDGRFSYGFGEQDLFITSELNDYISFLGETVVKCTPVS